MPARVRNRRSIGGDHHDDGDSIQNWPILRNCGERDAAGLISHILIYVVSGGDRLEPRPESELERRSTVISASRRRSNVSSGSAGRIIERNCGILGFGCVGTRVPFGTRCLYPGSRDQTFRSLSMHSRLTTAAVAGRTTGVSHGSSDVVSRLEGATIPVRTRRQLTSLIVGEVSRWRDLNPRPNPYEGFALPV